MAGRAVAHLDDVLALGLQGEVLIEGSYAVDLGYPDVQLLGDALQDGRTEVFILRLNVLHYGDEVVDLTVIAVDDLLHPLHGNSICHSVTGPPSK